jgi:hypothetical protein
LVFLDSGVSDILVSYILVWDISVYGNFSFRTLFGQISVFGHFGLRKFQFSDTLPQRLKPAFIPSAVFFVSDG